VGQKRGVGGGGDIETHTNCVCFEVFSVEKYNINILQQYLVNNIKFDIRQIWCIFFIANPRNKV
jgi:hypothetical protein